MNGYNFTERVRKSLALAREAAARHQHEDVGEHILLGIIEEGEGVMVEARELHHSYVGTEHVLLGLIREEQGIPAQTLRAMGVTHDVVRKETLRLLGTEMPPDESGAPTFVRERARVPESANVPASPGGVASIAIDVKFLDGSNVKGDFHDVERAYRFLVQLMNGQ